MPYHTLPCRVLSCLALPSLSVLLDFSLLPLILLGFFLGFHPHSSPTEPPREISSSAKDSERRDRRLRTRSRRHRHHSHEAETPGQPLEPIRAPAVVDTEVSQLKEQLRQLTEKNQDLTVTNEKLKKQNSTLHTHVHEFREAYRVCIACCAPADAA